MTTALTYKSLLYIHMA